MKSPVKMLTDLASRLTGTRDALNDLHATDKELRTMDEDLQAERRRLCSARPLRADVIAEAERQVDAIAATWPATHGPIIVAAVAPPYVRAADLPQGLRVPPPVVQLAET